MSWSFVALLVVGTYILRAVGLVVLGGIQLPRLVKDVLSWCPAAIIAGLMILGTFGDDGSIVIDARLAGMTAAVLAALLRAPFVVIFGTAIGVTAGVRALGF